jgi:hypothetical protein
MSSPILADHAHLVTDALPILDVVHFDRIDGASLAESTTAAQQALGLNVEDERWVSANPEQVDRGGDDKGADQRQHVVIGGIEAGKHPDYGRGR